MKTVHFIVQPLLDLFARLQAITMPEMKTALGSRADVTVFRKLATLPYRTSYSDRGRFYTLDSIAHFDAQGLWFCREACFSRQGTLLNTTEAFVQGAPAGCFAHELTAQLRVPVKDALRQLVQSGRLHRQLFGQLYLYTAPDRTSRQEQWAVRQAQVHAGDSAQEQLRAAIVLFYSLLDEQQRRLYAGLESLRQGHGGDQQMAQSLGLDADTVARGRRQLLSGEVERERVRRAGGGRPRAEKKRPSF
jgi:hypothetical protein